MPLSTSRESAGWIRGLDGDAEGLLALVGCQCLAGRGAVGQMTGRAALPGIFSWSGPSSVFFQPRWQEGAELPQMGIRRGVSQGVHVRERRGAPAGSPRRPGDPRPPPRTWWPSRTVPLEDDGAVAGSRPAAPARIGQIAGNAPHAVVGTLLLQGEGIAPMAGGAAQSFRPMSIAQARHVLVADQAPSGRPCTTGSDKGWQESARRSNRPGDCRRPWATWVPRPSSHPGTGHRHRTGVHRSAPGPGGRPLDPSRGGAQVPESHEERDQ